MGKGVNVFAASDCVGIACSKVRHCVVQCLCHEVVGSAHMAMHEQLCGFILHGAELGTPIGSRLWLWLWLWRRSRVLILKLLLQVIEIFAEELAITFGLVQLPFQLLLLGVQYVL